MAVSLPEFEPFRRFGNSGTVFQRAVATTDFGLVFTQPKGNFRKVKRLIAKSQTCLLFKFLLRAMKERRSKVGKKPRMDRPPKFF